MGDVTAIDGLDGPHGLDGQKVEEMERGKKREVQFPVKAISCLSHHEIWIRSIVCPVQKLFRILRFFRTNPYLNSAYRENSVVPSRLILRIGTECRGIMTIRDLSDFPKGSGKTGFHFRFDIELKILFFSDFSVHQLLIYGGISILDLPRRR